MKLVLGLTLLFFCTMVSWVSTENEENNELNEVKEILMGAEEIQSDENDSDEDDGLETEDPAYSQDDKSSIGEIQRSYNNRGRILHGDTIALQTFDRRYWVSCKKRYCGRATCPNMYMTGHDWVKCNGETFRIYRSRGPGRVRVGDKVGLYYLHKPGKWLGCPSSKCEKKSCPGIPTYRYGFATSRKWTDCWGEVFEIYARGKRRNSAITADDDVALYYIKGDRWLAQGSTKRRSCFGKKFPPRKLKYDVCPYETFTIWKRRC